MTIIYNYTLLYRKNTYIVIRIFIGNNVILYKCYMEYIYACIIPLSQFSPCTALLCMEKHDETAQEQSFSSLQSSKGERSNILQGRCEQHPIHTTDAAHFPGCHQKVSLCHMVYKITRKEYGILYLCLYLYCRIGILQYCCISVLSHYSLYLLFAIRLYIFLYLYFCFRFLCSTSIFLA